MHEKFKALAPANLTLHYVSLGPAPKLVGIKAFRDSPDAPESVVLDLDLRVAGASPNAVVSMALPAGAGALKVQLSSLQLSTVARVSFRRLAAKLPPFEALTVSLLGTPFIDFGITALSGDLSAVPGFEGIVANAIRSQISAFMWPKRLLIPLTSEAEADPALQPSAQGAVLVRLHAGRNLPVSDTVRQTTDPYVRLAVEGEPFTAESVHRRSTRKPRWGDRFVLPLTDVTRQSLDVQLWDENGVSADELVATAHVKLDDALFSRETVAGEGGETVRRVPKVLSAWVQLKRESGNLGSAMHSVASTVGLGGAKEGRPDGGELLIEAVFVPFAPQDETAPPYKLPRGWALPSPHAAAISVTLLRGTDLQFPAGWKKPHPFVTFKLTGGSGGEHTSLPSYGNNPAWHELFYFPTIDLSKKPIHLHLVVSAGQIHASLPGMKAAGSVLSGAMSVVSGATSAVTLGAVGGGGAEDVKLRGRHGGFLGRDAEGDSDVPPTSDAAFCGRGKLDVSALAALVRDAGGPVAETVQLLEVPGGSITVIVNVHRFNAVGSLAGGDSSAALHGVEEEEGAPTEAAAAAAAAAAEPDALPLEEQERGGGCGCSCLPMLGRRKEE